MRHRIIARKMLGKNNPAFCWHVILTNIRDVARRFRTLKFGSDILARAYFYGGGPIRKRDWKIASLLFPKNLFSAKSAAAWADAHGYRWIRVEG